MTVEDDIRQRWVAESEARGRARQSSEAAELADIDHAPDNAHPTNMTDPASREEIDAKIAAAEARGDTKIARMEGKLDLVLSTVNVRFDAVTEQITGARSNQWVIAFGLAGLFLTVVAIIVAVAFGMPAIYSLGTQTRDIVREEVKAALPTPPAPAVPVPPAK
jgi:hypothetical protein